MLLFSGDFGWKISCASPAWHPGWGDTVQTVIDAQGNGYVIGSYASTIRCTDRYGVDLAVEGSNRQLYVLKYDVNGSPHRHCRSIVFCFVLTLTA